MPAPRLVVVTGATGLVGRRLVAGLYADGSAVRALTRSPERAPLPGVELRAWDGTSVDRSLLRGADAIVHLAGESIFGGLPDASRRQRMRESRIDSARELAHACGGLAPAERPRVFVCASAVGYYGDRGEEILDESSPPGNGFLADLCVDWEAAAADVEAHGVRRVSLRFAVVLAREGGALAQLARVFRLGLGGRVGNGRQWFPWIHVDDVVGLVRAALERDDWRGPINAVAPECVRNAEFTRALARAVRRPALFPVPAFAVRAALRDLAGELLGSKRVVPRFAETHGYAFAYPQLEAALAAEV
ncbi:MAG TPA: TIGR01777 family oxidoreductase [Myxococcota bacterium]|nr:TIGR01777 family oxidoreductase [Myxococcota bacterium]